MKRNPAFPHTCELCGGHGFEALRRMDSHGNGSREIAAWLCTSCRAGYSPQTYELIKSALGEMDAENE